MKIQIEIVIWLVTLMMLTAGLGIAEAGRKRQIPVAAEITKEHYQQGLDYYRRKDYFRAKVEFDKVLFLSPDYKNAKKYLKSATQKMLKDLKERSKEDYRVKEAPRRKASVCDYLYDSGRDYYFAGRYQEAFERFKQVLLVNSAHKGAKVYLLQIQKELHAKNVLKAEVTEEVEERIRLRDETARFKTQKKVWKKQVRYDKKSKKKVEKKIKKELLQLEKKAKEEKEKARIEEIKKKEREKKMAAQAAKLRKIEAREAEKKSKEEEKKARIEEAKQKKQEKKLAAQAAELRKIEIREAKKKAKEEEKRVRKEEIKKRKQEKKLAAEAAKAEKLKAREARKAESIKAESESQRVPPTLKLRRAGRESDEKKAKKKAKKEEKKAREEAIRQEKQEKKLAAQAAELRKIEAREAKKKAKLRQGSFSRTLRKRL